MFLNIKLESVLISLDYKVAMATMQGGITLLQLQKKGRGRGLVSGLGTNSRLQGRSIDFAALSSNQSAHSARCQQVFICSHLVRVPNLYFGTLYTIQLENLTSSHPICCQHWGSSSGVTLFYTCLWKPSTPYQHLPVKYFGFFFTTGIIITTQIFFHQLASGAK